MLKVIDFYLSADNYRTRYEYVKEDIKFEIDDYTIPEMKIVAIEGEENKIQKILNDIQRTTKNKIN